MRFLFVTKEYFPTPDASGRIVYTLVQELIRQGHCVDVIAKDEQSNITDNGQETVYWLKNSAWERLCKKVSSADCRCADKLVFKLVAGLRKAIMAFKLRRFPNVETGFTRKAVKLYEKTLSNNRYDLVIGFFRPFSCFDIAMKISQRCHSSKCVCCYFDMVEDKHCPSFMPLRLYKRLIAKGDRRVFAQSEYIMLPSAAKQVENPLYSQYGDKIVYYDFPTFIVDDTDAAPDVRVEKNKDTLKFVYAGTLSVKYRNPGRMLDVLNGIAGLAPEKMFQLDIFGGGDVAELINSYIPQDNFKINYHGRVEKSIVMAYEREPDVLLNIMNAYATMVPSKIFGLFASGKPLLNFMTKSDDSSLKYIEQYPVAYTVLPQTDIEIVCKEVQAFLDKYVGYSVDMQKVEKIYQTCTPKYVVGQITRMCGVN